MPLVNLDLKLPYVDEVAAKSCIVGYITPVFLKSLLERLAT